MSGRDFCGRTKRHDEETVLSIAFTGDLLDSWIDSLSAPSIDRKKAAALWGPQLVVITLGAWKPWNVPSRYDWKEALGIPCWRRSPLECIGIWPFGQIPASMSQNTWAGSISRYSSTFIDERCVLLAWLFAYSVAGESHSRQVDFAAI